MPDQVRLEIDGTDVTVARGANLVTAAQAAGAYVPHLCWEEGLAADGCCGLCTVGVSGRSGPVLACETRAREGMVVSTSDRAAVAIRRRRLELIKADHRNDCGRCPKHERCELQEACRAAGVDLHVPDKLAYPADSDESHPLFSLDRSRCILCGKCVKVCRDLQGLAALEVEGRGFARRVRGTGGTDLGASFCESCGQCVDRCPTASLLPEVLQAPTGEVRSLCPYCGVGCALWLELHQDALTSVRAAADGPANAGALCVKGRFGLTDVVNSPDRLRQPQMRSNGTLRPASWDEVLGHVAGRLKEHVGQGTFALLASAKATTEENYLLQKFARVVMGTNNVDHSARLCHAPTVTGLTDCFGSGAMTGAIDDLDRTGCIVVIGSNTTESHPVIGTRIRRAQRRRGTPLVVIDPRRTDLAQRADVWLRPGAGSDVAVLAGLARVVIDESLVDRAFVNERCVGYREFVSSLEEFTAPRVEALTGIPRDEIRNAARAIGKAKSAMFLFAMGLTQHAHGTENVRALADLVLLTGNVGKVGAGVAPLRGHTNVQGACDAGALPDVLPGYQRVEDPVARNEAAMIWGREPPAEPGLPLTELGDAILEKRIRALWVVGENPCLADPDATHVQEALRSLDLLVVQDLFFTETAGLAHVVLPAASFAEKDGTFTNTERRVQLVRKAVEPPGQSRSDLDIVCALAQKMGAEGFAYDSAADVMDELALLVPLYRGISHRRLAQSPAGLQWPCPSSDHPGTATLHEVAFARPHGKAAFVPLQHRPVAEPVDEEYPLVLSTGRSLWHSHTGTMTRRVAGLNELRNEENVEVHPEDAGRLGVVDGRAVRVTSRRGTVTARARVTDACPEGTVFMTFHFAESPTNQLTIGALDPESKIAELKVCAVRVEPAAEDELAAPRKEQSERPRPRATKVLLRNRGCLVGGSDTMVGGRRTMRIYTLIFPLLFAASAVADDVILKDGRVYSGKVVDEGKRYTVVDRDRKFAVGKAAVARVVSKPSFMDDYEARLKKLPFDDAEAIFEFGRWLEENEWPTRAGRAYEEVLELDPDHRGARRALGFKLYEGEWVGPEELNRRRGLVKFEGRWYTKRDLEQLQKEIESNEKLRRAIEHRRRENLKINRMVKKFATFDKKKRQKAHDELYRYAETLNSPELRKFADDTKAYFDERVRYLCARMMARTEIQATRTKLKRPIENFVTNLGAAIAFISAQNPVTIQLPQIDMVEIRTTADIPAGCK